MLLTQVGIFNQLHLRTNLFDRREPFIDNLTIPEARHIIVTSKTSSSIIRVLRIVLHRAGQYPAVLTRKGLHPSQPVPWNGVTCESMLTHR